MRSDLKRNLRTGVPQQVFERLSPRAVEALAALATMMTAGAGRYQFEGDMPTLIDIAVMNGSDAVAGLIDEATQAHPELSLGYARSIKGINYKTLVRTANPVVSFRNANEGTATTKGTYENRLFETFIMDPRWECDVAVADRHEDGPEALIALEGSAIVEGSMQTLASQFYYGSANDAKGFPGLIAAYDEGAMLVKAGGTTASTQTSCWAVRFGPKDVGWVWGNRGELELSDVSKERVLDVLNNPFTAYCQNLLCYPGLQCCSIKSIGRIANIHPTDATATADLTDDDIADLLALFPVGKPPHYLFMNRLAWGMLRKSRTATSPTGEPAPFPDESYGIPIAPTDAITSIEAVVA